MGEKVKLDYREECLFKYWKDATIENLPIGDIIENGYCIERKSAQDFLSSILDRRIFNQSINMADNYPGKCVIIVEGDLKSLSDTIHFSGIQNITIEGVRGAIASLYTKYHVPVLLVSNRHGFVEMTNKLLEKNKECNEELTIIEPPILKRKVDPKLQILMQVPHVGFKKAQIILGHYALFSNIGKIDRPKGISQKDVDTILEVLK